jgi:hypothetical protein
MRESVVVMRLGLECEERQNQNECESESEEKGTVYRCDLLGGQRVAQVEDDAGEKEEGYFYGGGFQLVVL